LYAALAALLAALAALAALSALHAALAALSALLTALSFAGSPRISGSSTAAHCATASLTLGWL